MKKVTGNCVSLAVVLSLALVLGVANADIYSGLVAHWKFDETSGTTATDSSGNNLHASLENGAFFTAGQIRNGVEMDGTDDYVDLPIGSLISSLTNSTFATWANFSNEGGAWQRIFDFGTGTTVYMFLTPRIGTAEPMRFAITVGGGGDPEQMATAPSTLASGWHHVAVTIDADSGTISLYLDGAVVADNTATTLTPSDLGNTTQNWLGRSQYTADGYYDGSLDDFRIYDRVLSLDDIVELMNWAGGANAGPDQRVEAGTEVTLSGAGPGDATSITWEQIITGDEPAVTLADPSSLTTTFTPPVGEIGYILSFRLTVVSPTEGTTTDECLVYVTAPNEPRLSPANFRSYPGHLSFRLEWDPLVDAEKYGVGFKMGTGYFWFWTTDPYYNLVSLEEGSATVVAVKARNSYGDGPLSEEVTLVPMQNYALPDTLGGTEPPSEYVYVISHYTITDMNDAEIEDDTNDSWNGIYKSEDYWGYLWSEPILVDHVVYFTGEMFADGGWFTDLKVQYTQDGTEWLDVPTGIAPAYDFTDQRAGRQAYQRFDLAIPALLGTGVRIYGAPGGIAGFTSISELEVLADHVTARPLVVQGIHAEVPERSTGTLDASFSFSTRGDITSMIYEQTSGPSVTITVTGDPLIATFEAPGVDADTELVFTITGSDGTDTLSDEVTVVVKNLLTTAVAGPDQSVEEGTAATLDGSGSVTTTGTLTYQWTQTSGDPVTLNNANAAIADFEAPVIWDYTEELTFRLDVDDGAGGTSSDEVMIEVANSLARPAYPLEGTPDTGYIQDMLHMGDNPSDRILAPLNINNDPLAKFGGQAFVNPVPGEQYDFTDTGVTVTRNPMTWTPLHEENGIFGNEAFDNFEQVYHVYVICPDERDARLRFFHDDEIRIWNNGLLVALRDGWNDVTEQSEDFVLNEGLNSMTIKFEDGTGGNWIQVRLTDRADIPYEDLYYSFGPSFVLADAYAVRELPTSYQTGGNVEVTLSMRVNPDDTPSSVTISEPIPGGLTVVDAGGGSQVGGSINWSFSGNDVATQMIHYTLGVSAGTTGGLDFTGTVSFPTTDSIKGDNVVYEVPAAPQNLSAELLLAAHLSWSASPEEGVVSYRVYRSVNGQAWEEIGLTSNSSFTDTAVVEGNTYNYQIAAVNAGGVEGSLSPPSGEKTVVMETREAENFNYGGGLWPWTSTVTTPAVEAAAQDDLDSGNDFWHPNKGGPNDYRPLDAVGIWEMPVYGVTQQGLGWIQPGSWWRYTFEVPEPGPNDPEGGWVMLVFRVEWPSLTTFAAYWDEELVGTATFTTGAWGVFTDVVMEQFQTTSGLHTLRVEAQGSDPNVDVLDFDKIGIGFNWTKPTREDIFFDDFESYTTLYSFADLVAAGYTVNNGSGVAEGAWLLWNTAGNNLGNEAPDIDSMTNNYVITDSDLSGSVDVDEELITPAINCTNHTKVRLDFNKNYRTYPDDTDHNQTAEVDVRSSDDGTTWGDWATLLHYDRTTVTEFDTAPEQVDLSAHADGKFIQVRWRFYEANYDYWFAVDDIRVSGDALPPAKGEILELGYVAGEAQLIWSAFGGGNYTVEYTEDLASGDWMTVPVPGQTWPITETTWSGDIGDLFDNGAYLRVRSE